MGFLRKRNNNNHTPEPAEVSEELETQTVEEYAEEDDFSPIIKKPAPKRGEFHQTAMEHFAEAAEEPANESREEASEDIPQSPAERENELEPENRPTGEEADDMPADTPDRTEEDDFSPAAEPESPEAEVSDDAGRDEADSGKKDEPSWEDTAPKEKKQLSRQTKRGIIIAGAAVLVILGALYSYACATVPTDRMGRNIYIENVNVSNMTFQEAVSAIEKTNILRDRKITVTCGGQTYSMNGADVGLTPRVTETVDKAMRYGKTGNIFIDGFANMLQLGFPHKVIPSASINEAILRDNLAAFGRQIHGELIEHTLEFGDGVVICAAGRSGFDNNTDTAYNEVVKALSDEKFSDIPVTLRRGSPRDMTTERVDSFAYRDPVNAAYVVENNVVSISEDIPCRFINKEETAPLAAKVKEGANPVEIPYYTAQAEITKAMLAEKLFNATLGTYSTNYGSSNANRCANIENAARKINGKVLGPKEVFSFNATVGPRSVANGFYTAKEYANGETVDGIGGGTCQVSSTLYNAVLYSDLAIVARTNHMFPVGYAPMGQDATVADSGIDFKFVNDTDYPIQISAVTAGRTITVSIIGTERDTPHTVKIINTPRPVGNDTSVHSVRQVFDGSGQLIRTDDLGNSYYMAHP